MATTDFDIWFKSLSKEEQERFFEEMEADSYLASADAHEM